MNPNKSDQNKMVLSPSESYLPYQGDSKLKIQQSMVFTNVQ